MLAMPPKKREDSKLGKPRAKPNKRAPKVQTEKPVSLSRIVPAEELGAFMATLFLRDAGHATKEA